MKEHTKVSNDDVLDALSLGLASVSKSLKACPEKKNLR